MVVTKLADGILRIQDETAARCQSLTERYGLLQAVREESRDTVSIDEANGLIRLSESKSIRFEIRGKEDRPFWSREKESMLEKFRDKRECHENVIGRPDNRKDPSLSNVSLLPSEEVHFGMAFEIGEKDRFYGLGEASRDRLELRGRAYQNWAYYQFDEIPIPFFMCSAGWGVLVNASGRNFADIGEMDSGRVCVLGEEDPLDVFFLYGTYREMLASLAKLTGRSMMLPQWAYALTYVAPIFANQFEVLAEAERFRQEGIPCDHISLEPGWCQEFYDYSTNPQWCQERFHMPSYFLRAGRENPQTFISALHRMGYHVSLWFCNRYDFTDEAERQVRGDDRNAFEPWYTHLGRMVEYGADGFKLDPADTLMRFDAAYHCANGLNLMQMHNLDQVLLPKQTYEGFSGQMNLRPMHHYCGGYIGSPRWSAATTGDNGGQRGSLVWILTLAMSGFSNTTVDMHIFDADSIHFGFMVAWPQLNAWSGMRQPWYAGPRMMNLFRDYAKLRYHLFPYIYSTALQAHEDCLPMVRPLPLAYPDFEPGFDNTCQYMMGDFLMVCAYEKEYDLPEGQWYDYFNGVYYDGPCRIPARVPENRGGMLLVRCGAILACMGREASCTREYDRSVIQLEIYPRGKSETVLREDDGLSLEYETGTSCHTLITCDEKADETVITIGKSEGSYAGKPDKRLYRILVTGGTAPVHVICEDPDADWTFADP